MIKNLTAVQFGDRATRDKWQKECVEARRVGRQQGRLHVVSPRHTFPTDRGPLAAGAEVFAWKDFEGFTSPYQGDTEVEQLPMSAADALQRALDLGVVLDCLL